MKSEMSLIKYSMFVFPVSELIAPAVNPGVMNNIAPVEYMSALQT